MKVRKPTHNKTHVTHTSSFLIATLQKIIKKITAAQLILTWENYTVERKRESWKMSRKKS